MAWHGSPRSTRNEPLLTLWGYRLRAYLVGTDVILVEPSYLEGQPTRSFSFARREVRARPPSPSSDDVKAWSIIISFHDHARAGWWLSATWATLSSSGVQDPLTCHCDMPVTLLFLFLLGLHCGGISPMTSMHLFGGVCSASFRLVSIPPKRRGPLHGSRSVAVWLAASLYLLPCSILPSPS